MKRSVSAKDQLEEVSNEAHPAIFFQKIFQDYSSLKNSTIWFTKMCCFINLFFITIVITIIINIIAG